jgi:competence protein ComEA
MSTGPIAGLRRWAVICLPVVVVLILFLIGRRATNAATVGVAPIASSDASPVNTNDASAAAEAADAPATDAPRLAVEQLPDGAVIVDLNVATESDLRKLPGVGPTRAKKIVDLRTHLGRFKSVDDLARIKGFGRATIRKLRPLTRVSPP